MGESVETQADDNEIPTMDTNKLVKWAVSHSYTIVTFVVLVIAFIFLLFFLPRPSNYFDYQKICPALEQFSAEFCEEIMDEYGDALKQTDVHEIYDQRCATHSFDFPLVYQAVQRIPDVQRAFIVKIPAKSEQQEIRYPKQWANNTLRCIVALYVPSGNQTAVVVDQEIKFIKTEKPIIIDASHPNRVFNKQKRRDAMLLVIDIARPDHVPRGTSDTQDLPYWSPFGAIQK